MNLDHLPIIGKLRFLASLKKKTKLEDLEILTLFLR